ncbi:expressed unknown protein [Seminavis robusta]|uniref:Uncharacterized protein n=1 Tax=Seminavis robusta TaxID=568900 RepID=A0A9N8EG80_9STRA|nr:expressed unknown protein [Seminavis robusta]|eukprot:Sro1143_g245920.1 n/a (186) ;mRNA; r:6530-7087
MATRSPISVTATLYSLPNKATTVSNQQVQDELFTLVSAKVYGAPNELLRQFWGVLLDGRNHAFLEVTSRILGKPDHPNNTNISAFGAFRRLVQHMCDRGVVTWTHAHFEKKLVQVVNKDGKTVYEEMDDDEEDDAPDDCGNEYEETEEHKRNKKESRNVKIERWTDGVLRLTDKPFPRGRPRYKE